MSEKCDSPLGVCNLDGQEKLPKTKFSRLMCVWHPPTPSSLPQNFHDTRRCESDLFSTFLLKPWRIFRRFYIKETSLCQFLCYWNSSILLTILESNKFKYNISKWFPSVPQHLLLLFWPRLPSLVPRIFAPVAAFRTILLPDMNLGRRSLIT